MSIHDISITIDKALSAAGLNPNSKALASVADTIRKALTAAGIAQTPTAPEAERDVDADVAPGAAGFDRVAGSTPPIDRATEPRDVGQFSAHSHSNGLASRGYKLYVPATCGTAPMPLVVMLHGCRQNPDDFARGTRMNELAERHGFLVAYPAQTTRANGSNCWNWFNRAEQSRGGEEPSLIAGIVRDIGRSHRIDESRVFAAGLSAGAAMAVILAATYPEVFSAVAAHSGLPLGAAHDVSSAFAAMKGTPSRSDFTGRPSRNSERFADARPRTVPTLVFHGDGDATVAASNADLIVDQAVHGFSSSSGQTLEKRRSTVAADRGRAATVTRFVDEQGRTLVEQWLVHGAPHAWSGGSPDGSYTDAQGPDASSEMIRFFFESAAR